MPWTLVWNGWRVCSADEERRCGCVAYKFVTDIRPCGPKRDAIRGATFGDCTPAPRFRSGTERR